MTEAAPTEPEAASRLQQNDLCPHCVKPIARFDHFCPHCGGPVTAHAAIDPLGQVYAQGYAYLQATTSDKPKFIVVLGIWLIFGPLVLFGLVGLFWISMDTSRGISLLANPGGLAQPVGENLFFNLLVLLLGASMISLHLWIIWAVTRHYFQTHHDPPT